MARPSEAFDPTESEQVEGLTVTQSIVFHAIANGQTFREDAIRAGVTERTVYIYRKKPIFQQLLRQRLLESTDISGAESASSLPTIVTQLKDILSSARSSPADKIAAAKVLMQSTSEYQARQVLEARILDLEQRLSRFARASGRNVTPIPGVTDANAPGRLPGPARAPEDDEDDEDDTEDFDDYSAGMYQAPRREDLDSSESDESNVVA